MAAATAIIPITREEAATRDPAATAPPLITDDGHTQAVGEAHGRMLPLIGGSRPYLYDVAVGGSGRVYADTVNDAMAMYLGGRYAELAAELSDLDRTLPARPALSYEAPIDDVDAVLLSDLDDLTDEVSEAELDRFSALDEAVTRRNRLLYEMALIRRQHADQVRIDLQARINDEARADGTWDQLSHAEQTELTASADPHGTSPAGVIEEVPTVRTTSAGTAEPVLFERGTWFATTSLVVNTGDYTPWTDIPFVHSALILPDQDGVDCEVPTRSNLVILDIDTDEDYLQSLAAAGVVKLRVWPDEQPDEVFRAMTTDTVVYPKLRIEGGPDTALVDTDDAEPTD
ncbi:MAG: hypothetical protein WA988_16195 [Candidatus Nanopelagicales bacterium]